MDIDINNSEYFSSYEDLEVHRLMLEDTPRNEAYKNAILSNSAYFKDKVVMDVGCGTGILSIFCAQAGAKKVYAVEASNLANIAMEVVRENNYEHIIEVLHSKVEDVTLPNSEKVDAIISEWMGFYLLHEGMLDSVLIARDKFLKDGGEMFPENAAIYVAPCSISTLYQKWSNIHGVSMSSFAKHLRAEKGSKPDIQILNPEELLGDDVTMCWINLREDKLEDLNSFTIEHVVGASKSGNYQGICLWFDCLFPDLAGDREEGRTTLSTSPLSPPTHWKQTIIVLPQEQHVEAGEPIAFKLDMTRDVDNGRRYNLQLTMLDPEAIEHPLPCSCDMTKCILIKTFMAQHAEQSMWGDSESNGANHDEIEDGDEPIDE